MDYIHTTQKYRIAMVDYIKAIAMILVITNHSLGTLGNGYMAFFFVIRMAVPIFVLISGYNFAASFSAMPSMGNWYRKDRLLKKMWSWILPMLGVFAVWTCLLIVKRNFSPAGWLKSFMLQSYGLGAYYFWIIMEIYLIFALVFVISHNPGGYCLLQL